MSFFLLFKKVECCACKKYDLPLVCAVLAGISIISTFLTGSISTKVLN